MTNNPGKLIKGPVPFIGEKLCSSDPDYRQFYDIEFGYRAMFIEIRMLIKLGYSSIRKILIRWLPRPQEQVDAYVQFVTIATAIPEDMLLNPEDKQQMVKLVSAISHFESGDLPVESKVIKAWNIISVNSFQ